MANAANPDRKIAEGSGTTANEVNRLTSQFEMVQKMTASLASGSMASGGMVSRSTFFFGAVIRQSRASDGLSSVIHSGLRAETLRAYGRVETTISVATTNWAREPKSELDGWMVIGVSEMPS